jgi:hypothetical protein
VSTQSILTTAAFSERDSERGHRVRLFLGYVIAITLVIAVVYYGFDYYGLDALQRPYSPKHRMLRPSGYIGIKLGILGISMFAVIFLYPLRKRWRWLQSKGSSRHWLDFHVLLGLFAPLVIALHASFKFQGIAGMAFWLMLSVALSGIAGRYLYSQIPRRVNSAEMSLKESREMQQELMQKLSTQKVVSPLRLSSLFRLPSEQQVARWPMLVCLAYMVLLDIMRPFRVARLRTGAMSFTHSVLSLGGLLPTNHADLESVIRLAREQASLSKRIVFLSRAQQVFHLWHVVHKPFSYSFIVLALVHIGVVMALGFM